MRIALANDHAGTALKNEIAAWLQSLGHEVVDFGTFDEQPCDLPDYVYPAALAVSRGECERGIFVDGVGYGSAMIANKLPGVCRRRAGPVLRLAGPLAFGHQRAVHRRQDHWVGARHGSG